MARADAGDPVVPDMIRLGLLVMLVACSRAASPSPEPVVDPAPVPTAEASMDHAWIDLPRRRIQVPAGELAVFDTGGDGEVVLLVHGLGSTSAFWQKQLTGGRLDGYRLVAPDLPGWGDSDQPDAAYTPAFYAEQLVALLDALGVERAHVVGHSMGGQAAISLALSRPDRVRSLVLSAPAGIETFTPEESALLRAFWTEERLRDRTEEVARASYGLVFSRWDEDVERLLQARMKVDGSPRFAGLVRAIQRSVAGMLDEPVYGRLGELGMPAMYVYGDQDAMIPARALHPAETPKSIAERARVAIPGLQVEAIPGAGHTPHHDAPEAFDALLRSFLEAH